MSKYTLDKLKPEEVKGDWSERADPKEAWGDLVEKGYDPDDEYIVGSTNKEGVYDPVFEGNLLECLTKASELSTQGYFVVMLKSDLEKFRMEVH